MERLPDELLFAVLSHLDLQSLTATQSVNRRLLALARDENTWRTECFHASRAGVSFALNRARLISERREAEATDTQSEPEDGQTRPDSTGSDGTALGRLRRAVSRFTSGDSVEDGCPSADEPSMTTLRKRALANWDPAYRSEHVDYYHEYVHRHAPMAPTAYLEVPSDEQAQSRFGPDTTPEILGMDVMRNHRGQVEAVVAPLEDGSVGIWDMDIGSTGQHSGRVLARSKPGLLPRSKNIISAPAECVSVDRAARTAFFAVDCELLQIDLDSLQQVSTTRYPANITALSQSCSPEDPLTIGTATSLHLFDHRAPNGSARELSTTSFHIPSGPTSILHLSDAPSSAHQICTAGRHKALMMHDRRNFPALLAVQFSGAQISSLARLPYVQKPVSANLLTNPDLSMSDLEALKARRGVSVLAAGEYSGKGSLEIYGLVSPAIDPDTASRRDMKVVTEYRNRQTVSSSPALSASPHGASLVVADGNGALKWFERDGFTPIRSHSLVPDKEERQTLFRAQSEGDVVRKILQTAAASDEAGDLTTGRNDLLLWTGDGKIGVLGFGHSSPLECDSPVVETWDAEEDARIQFERKMSRLLVSQADEVRFMNRMGWIGA